MLKFCKYTRLISKLQSLKYFETSVLSLLYMVSQKDSKHLCYSDFILINDLLMVSKRLYCMFPFVISVMNHRAKPSDIVKEQE